MTLREKQAKFARLAADLIIFIYASGYEISFGDAWATEGHKKGSFHYKRLAIDLNLFKDGKWLPDTADYAPFGEYWESFDPQCTWGGRWNDGNHYSLGEKIDTQH